MAERGVWRGRTVEEAVMAACLELGARRDQVEFEVVEEPSRALFGLVQREAVVEVWLAGQRPAPLARGSHAERGLAAEDEGESQLAFIGARRQEPMRRGEAVDRFVRDLLDAAGIDAAVEMERAADEALVVRVEGEDVGRLIGHHGQTLEALQYLVNVVASRRAEQAGRVRLDVGGYRRRREAALRRLARRAAEQVSRTGRPLALEPMSAADRRVIHVELQDSLQVTTESEGEGEARHVVVSRRPGALPARPRVTDRGPGPRRPGLGPPRRGGGR